MAKSQSYQQIQKQIAQLQSQAERMRRVEVAGVVARIRKAIDAYGLTAADLGFDAAPPKAQAASGKRRNPLAVNPFKARPAGSSKAPKARKAAKAPKAREVRYRDADGHTWGGIGKRPQWLRDKIEAGHKLEEFKVDPAT